MRHGLSVAALLSLLTLVGCGGSMKTTRFANPNFDFSFVVGGEAIDPTIAQPCPQRLRVVVFFD